MSLGCLWWVGGDLSGGWVLIWVGVVWWFSVGGVECWWVCGWAMRCTGWVEWLCGVQGGWSGSGLWGGVECCWSGVECCWSGVGWSDDGVRWSVGGVCGVGGVVVICGVGWSGSGICRVGGVVAGCAGCVGWGGVVVGCAG